MRTEIKVLKNELSLNIFPRETINKSSYNHSITIWNTYKTKHCRRKLLKENRFPRAA